MPTQGLTPSDDYVTSSIDSVDLDNGNLIVNIPIVSYKQKGKLPPLSLHAVYNNVNWGYSQEQDVTCVPLACLLGGPADDEPTQTDSYNYWVFMGSGMQITRPDSLTFGTFSIPVSLSNDEPGTYNVNYIQDGLGTQHLLYSLPTLNSSRAMDGSGIAIASGGIADSSGNTYAPALLPEPSGTPNLSFTEIVTDVMGNKITPNITTSNYISTVNSWTDSVGRTIPAPNTGYISGCYTYQYPTTNNGTAPYTFCYSTIPITGTFSASSNLSYQTIGGPLQTLTSIQLPNGKSYTFSYDAWGGLSKISLPSGGSITYQWVSIGQNQYANRVLQQRIVDPADGTPVRTWTYCFGGIYTACSNVPAGANAMFDPDGNETLRYVLHENYATTVNYQGPASNGVVLQSVKTTYCNSPSSVFYHSPLPDPMLPCQTDTTLSDGEIVTQTTTYDTPVLVNDGGSQGSFEPVGQNAYASIGLPVTQTVSSYGTSPAGPVVKSTNTQYLWQSNSSYFAANILNTPSSVTITDGSGNTASQTIYGYDESNGSPQGIYGENTSISRWLNTTGQSLQTTTKYNAQGMPTDTYDANWNAGVSGQPGDHINTAYDATGLYPATVTQTPTTNASHVDYYSYDSNTSNLISHTDQNGSQAGDPTHTTSSTYDNMGRTTGVSYPDGGGSTFCYTDVGGATCAAGSAPYTTYSTTRLNGSTSLTSSVSYNGLGQVVSSVTPDGATTATTYDLLGRVASVSNPYFTSGSPSQVTATTYDALGRKTLVTEADHSMLSWQYTGPVTDTWDENGTHMQDKSDSLGRLVKVMELGTTSNPVSQETDYSYDVLGDLLNVNQMGLTRSFTYDSLSRLMTSTNPETGTICYGQWSSGTCAGGYDANGNLLYKADARGVVTAYGYDALSRLTSKGYTTPSSVATTAPSSFIYDGLPSASVPNAVGKLVQEYTGSSTSPLTERTITSYDAMGRLLGEQQCVSTGGCTGANTYSLSYMYDLVGDRTYLSNGVSSSAIGLTYGYDGAGRLTTITSSLANGSSYPGTLFGPPTTGMQYGPVGLLNANLGTPTGGSQPDFTMSRTYDNRLRLISESDIGTSVLTSAATPSTGQIAIAGSEQQTSTTATSATGKIVITGIDGSKQVCTYPGAASATSTKGISPDGHIGCTFVYDTGYLSITINGSVFVTAYGESSTDTSLATALAAAVNASSSIVTATSAGSAITLTSIASGSASDYPISVSNGADFGGTLSGSTMTGGGPVYDAGTITATINGTAIASSWGSGSTSASIASSLVSAINSQLSGSITASASGGTVQLSTVQTGSSTAGSISVSVSDSTSAFSSPSFSATASGLSGGANVAYSDVPVYSYTIPSGGYAPNSNLLSVNDSVTGNWNYTYDGLNRLTSGQAGTNTQGLSPYGTGLLQWSYDSFGNFNGQTFSGNSSATVTQAAYTFTGQSIQNGSALSGVFNNRIDGYNYDAAGNQLSDPVLGPNTYSYDAEGRLATANGSIQYIYDAEGRRVGKQSGGNLSTIYLLGPSGEQLTELNTTSGSMAWAHTNVYASGRLLTTYDNNGLHFEFSDWLGTKRVQVNANGLIEETCLSLPHGDSLSCSGPGYDATENHFTGKERDNESGLDYFGARYYASTMGRFSSPDPSGLLAANPADPQSWNMYAYARNNPLINIDPTGLDCVYYNDAGNGVEEVDHNSNSGECGKNGGNWEEGYTQADWQNYNKKTGTWTGFSADSTNVYMYGGVAPGGNGSGDGSNYMPACQGNCMYGTSASISSLNSQLQNGATLVGLLQFAITQTNWVGNAAHDLINFTAGASVNNWCGAGGAGVPGNSTDWSCLVHDYNYNVAGFSVSSNFNPTIFLQPTKVQQLQKINQALCNSVSGMGGAEISAYFHTIGSITAPCQ